MSDTINTETYQKNSSGGGCGKVLLWLFIIALILSCLCCLGLFGTGYYIASSLQKGLVEDPVVAEEKTVEAFGELNLPENIKPRAFISVNLFGRDFGFAGIYSWNITGEAVAEIPTEATEEAAPQAEENPAEAEPAESDPFDNPAPRATDNFGTIFFYALSDVFKGNEQEFVDAVSQGITQDKDKNYTVKRTETVPVTINGKANDFTFSWMENQNKQNFLMVSGSFTSAKETQCNVMIILPGEPSQETVINVLENIQK